MTRPSPRAAVVAVAATLTAVLAGTAPSHPAHAAGAPQVPGTACPSFPSDAVWNTDISTLPVHTRSTNWLASTGATSGRNLHPDFGSAYGIPFNVVTSGHATLNPTFYYASESDSGAYPWGSDLQVEAPTDSHLLSIKSDTCTLYETFDTNISAGTAGSGAIWNLNSDALRPASWTSADAAGLPIFPHEELGLKDPAGLLLLRPDEIDAGTVRHAVRFTVQQSDQSYLWPARHQAGTAADPTLPPMGARFRLRASFDTSSFGPEAQVVLDGFKHYGVIVADNGSNWFFQGSTDPEWDQPRYQTMVAQLKTVPASAFEAVDESTLMVDPNSAATRPPAPPPSPSTTSYFTWYDHASPGMLNDNIHIVDPDPTTPSQVSVRGPGASWNLTVPAGGERIVSWPGAIGGPVAVTVTAGPAVIATQRVQYQQSFNEVAAIAGSAAASDLWMPWYDLVSPGMLNDNVHVINPDPTLTSTVRMTVAGGSPQTFTIGPFGEAIAHWPGVIAGPVHVQVTSGPNVIASQRVEFNQSFNEAPATPAAAASARSFFTWFDTASPGMLADTVHLTNPDTATDASVTISGPGPDLHVTVPHGSQTYASWPSTIGGPVTVTVTSGPSVIASKRVRYGNTFNEVEAMPASRATSPVRFTWYDLASPGMNGDDVHVLNPGASSVDVTAALPGATPQTFTVGPGRDRYISWPGAIAGPLTVTATGPVVASQRVRYDDSFNEVTGL